MRGGVFYFPNLYLMVVADLGENEEGWLENRVLSLLKACGGSVTVRDFCTAGKITERVWDNLWVEWQDRRRTIQINLEALKQKREYHIANLDAALTIIAKVGILYNKLGCSDQKDLLRHVTEQVENSGGAVEGKTKTSAMAGQCSDFVQSDDPNGTRTRVHTLKGCCPRPLDDGA